jgi:hypothetical protein
MPDLTDLLPGAGAAAAVAALVVLALHWPAPTAGPRRWAVGWVLGVGVAFLLGCRLMGRWPHWPPSEDQDRFLALLVPAVTVVELAAALLPGRWWLVWPLRLVVAAGAAPLLLHQSVYLADLAGPDSAEWTPAQARLTLLVLGALLAAGWGGLELLAWRCPGRSLPLCLALTCAGAAAAVMLSGSYTGGQIGVPLAAALLGATGGSLALPAAQAGRAALGIALVGLFGLLVSGRYFASLSTTHALLLWTAPLLGWLPELPGLRQVGPWGRGLLRCLVVAVPVVVVVAEAREKFLEDSRSSPSAATKALRAVAEKSGSCANEVGGRVYYLMT